jgi:peptidoglycan/LPS O-acetylase OafA/YrhL
MPLANVAVALCLDWCVTFPEGRVGRVLNAAPLAFVGWISYSLDLSQQPFLDRSSTSAFAAFPLNILLTIALALASYFLVERPTLQFRKWLEQRQRRRRVAVPVGPDPRPGMAVSSGNAS